MTSQFGRHRRWCVCISAELRGSVPAGGVVYVDLLTAITLQNHLRCPSIIEVDLGLGAYVKMTLYLSIGDGLFWIPCDDMVATVTVGFPRWTIVFVCAALFAERMRE